MEICRTITTVTSAGVGGAMLACGACCIPLLAPLIGGLGLGTLGRALDERLSTWIGAGLVLLSAVLWLYGFLKPAKECGTGDSACGCAPVGEDKPIACTLSPGEFKERQTWLRTVTERFLLDSRVDGRVATLRYSLAGEGDVRQLVARESACCAFLSFDLKREVDVLRLAITAPPQAAADFASLIGHLLRAEVPAAQ